jgi:hypothetical protein
MSAARITNPNTDPIGVVEEFLIATGGVWAADFDMLKLAMLNPHSEDEHLTDDVKGANSTERKLPRNIRGVALEQMRGLRWRWSPGTARGSTLRLFALLDRQQREQARCIVGAA